VTGNAETHRKARQRLRRELVALGLPEAEIEARIALKAKQQRRARLKAARRTERAAYEAERATEAAAQRAQWKQEAYARLCPPDRGYRPSSPDPLTTGPARATGLTAKAARRGKAMTRWEYDEAQR
jgi:hypothetical protein